jgi:hypothetical protein
VTSLLLLTVVSGAQTVDYPLRVYGEARSSDGPYARW